MYEYSSKETFHFQNLTFILTQKSKSILNCSFIQEKSLKLKTYFSPRRWRNEKTFMHDSQSKTRYPRHFILFLCNFRTKKIISRNIKCIKFQWISIEFNVKKLTIISTKPIRYRKSSCSFQIKLRVFLTIENMGAFQKNERESHLANVVLIFTWKVLFYLLPLIKSPAASNKKDNSCVFRHVFSSILFCCTGLFLLRGFPLFGKNDAIETFSPLYKPIPRLKPTQRHYRKALVEWKREICPCHQIPNDLNPILSPVR